MVYLAEGASPGGTVELAIRSTGVRTRLDPPHAAVGAGGRIAVRNHSGAPHMLSVPGIGMLQRLDPGQQVEIPVTQLGDQSLSCSMAPLRVVGFVLSRVPSRWWPRRLFQLNGLAP